MRVAEGFDRAEIESLLSSIGGRVLQGFDPVADEDRRVLFRAGFGGGNDSAPWTLERPRWPAAGGGGIYDELAARGMRSHRAASSPAEGSGPTRLNLYSSAVKGAVPDEDQHEIVLGLDLTGDFGERGLQLCEGGLRAGQREDMRGTGRPP